MAVNLDLKANPDPVVIDTANDLGTTTIEYWKQPDQRLWCRSHQGPWRPVAIQTTSPTDSAHTHGTFVSDELKPGQVYEVGIWPTDNDPNYPEPEKPEQALKAIAVFALLKQPAPRHFFDHEDWTIGGTHYSHWVYTTQPVNAYEAVSTEAPSTDASGHEHMSKNLAVPPKFSPSEVSHLLNPEDLLPGTHYYVYTRLSDEAGNWEELWNNKTTKQRQIEFQVTSIFVDDDSDDLSDGEGGMSWKLESGSAGAPDDQWNDRGRIVYQGDYGSGNWVDAPTDKILVGPEAVDRANTELRVRLYVWDRDSGSFPPDSGDTAEKVSGLISLKLPNEDVLDQEEEIVAGPGGDGLKVTSKVKYSVRYL